MHIHIFPFNMYPNWFVVCSKSIYSIVGILYEFHTYFENERDIEKKKQLHRPCRLKIKFGYLTRCNIVYHPDSKI